MKGALLAMATVMAWAILNVINRYCILQFEINVIVYTSFLIFSGGIALILIRERVTPENWRTGVKYSWFYTIMQIIKSFLMISTFLYITSAETSLLFNIEIVLTYIFAYVFFKRKPYRGNYLGILVILIGFILFIFTLPSHIRTNVSILILLASLASCFRAVIVETTTTKNPETTLRQKCGISGYTMTIAGLFLILFFFIIALVKFFLADQLPEFAFVFKYLPSLGEVIHPQTIIAACLSGFFINSLSVYLYYATLRYTASETFMVFRSFLPLLTLSLEFWFVRYYAAMRPELSTKDYILGAIIIVGSLLILIHPVSHKGFPKTKNFIAE